MIGAETKRRLSEAFIADKYVQQLQQKMRDIIAYGAMPFTNEKPEAYKFYEEVLAHYRNEWWGGLLEDTQPKSDLAMAMGWAMIAHQQEKLLSTKHKNGKTVLENIDVRLHLYNDYSWYWLNAKNWEMTPKSILDKYRTFGYLSINHTPEPMTFAQWLYRSGYEALLTDREFLSAIRYFDSDNEEEYMESDSIKRQRIDFELKMRMS